MRDDDLFAALAIGLLFFVGESIAIGYAIGDHVSGYQLGVILWCWGAVRSGLQRGAS